ncbi:MAG: glycosyltransferase [Thermoleophilia bacterium]
MRVLLLSPYPPQRDGIGDHAASLAAALRAAGHEVGVVTPAPAAGAPPEVIASLGGRDLAARVRAFAPDVVHAQFAVAAFGPRALGMPRALARMRAATGARVVVTVHEATRDTALLRAPGRALYRRLGEVADVVLAHTPAAADALTGPIGVPAARVRRVALEPRPLPPPATDAAGLRATFGLGDDRLLLAFGFIHVDKGLDDLVSAFSLASRRDPDATEGVRIVVAGEVRRRRGPLRAMEARDRAHLASVRRMVRATGLSGRVTFTGFVPKGHMAPWFAAAAAVVLPYRRIEQSSVGGQAVAAGAPVVASTAGSLADDFGDPRWSFAPGDREGLAGALLRLLAADPADTARPAAPAAGDAFAATLAAYGGSPAREAVRA